MTHFERRPDPIDVLLNQLDAGIADAEARLGSLVTQVCDLEFDILYANRDYLNGEDLSLGADDQAAA